VSDNEKDVYNQCVLKEKFAECGIVYTDESKSDTMVPYRTLQDVTFLKRSFRFSDETGSYVAPLALDSIREMVNWSKKGADYYNIAITNVDTALHELSLHGEETYNELSVVLLRKSREILEFQPSFTSWSTVFYETCGYDNKW
jgi:hypothetical protein